MGLAIKPSDAHWRASVEDALDVALQARFGPWSAGWRWARDEGSLGGGVVSAWCCEAHSVLRKGERDLAPTALRAAAGLADWRRWLEELAAWFVADEGGVPPHIVLERRAHATLALVVERTSAGDAWYTHAAQVLSWLLQHRGLTAARADDKVRAAIRGRFQSWSSPSDDDRTDIARSLRDDVMAKDVVDGLAAWWRKRAATTWVRAGDAATPPVRAVDDALVAHAVRHDGAIDDDRGMRMLVAHELARAHAGPLTFDVVAAWQRAALGDAVDVALRTTDAWAKDGRERYGTPKDLAAKVAQALHDAGDPAIAPAARAARAYLDGCFLHPFVDGNGRAARLWLDHVLARAGLALDDAEGGLLRTPLPATDPEVGARHQALVAARVVRRP